MIYLREPPYLPALGLAVVVGWLIVEVAGAVALLVGAIVVGAAVGATVDTVGEVPAGVVEVVVELQPDRIRATRRSARAGTIIFFSKFLSSF
jgi:hypothetical protein